MSGPRGLGALLRDGNAAAPKLVAITEQTLATTGETLRRFERIARAARPGSVMFQLRDRALATRERLELGRELRALTRAEGQWLQVNDRLDLALVLGADAVHLAEGSVSVDDARRLLGTELLVSRPCHEVEAPLEPRVDAWLLSPIAAPRKGRSALGVGAIRRFRERSFPNAASNTESAAATLLYALGGVDASNARACMEAGASGVAVMGAVLTAAAPERLLDALEIAR